MKLSISNIAWPKENDEEMYEYISQSEFSGIEIAPTRIIENEPYSKIDEAKQISKMLSEKYNLTICSMQSIWLGRKERIFNSLAERKTLLNYTKKAIDFAQAINCKNLVFGCPKNRVVNDIDKDYKIGLDFFNDIGNYANDKEVCFSIEPNATIYNTNFITTTEEAFKLIKELNNPKVKVNVDLGTIIQNNEDISILKNNIDFINHVHISEPNLLIIQKRQMHSNLIRLLKDSNYNKYVSIEMKNQNDVSKVKNVINYISEICKEN